MDSGFARIWFSRLRRVTKHLKRQRRIRKLRRLIRSAHPLNVILGAGGTEFDGWLSTHKSVLDITSPHDWANLFEPMSIDRLLAEHVFEHLSEQECEIALAECYRYLRCGGLLRIAVPDGHRRDAEYVAAVAPPKDGHRILFTVDTLIPLLETGGFYARPLEYFDVDDQFYSVPWDEADGLVRRSSRFDTRERFRRGKVFYTSLIVDARKV